MRKMKIIGKRLTGIQELAPLGCNITKHGCEYQCKYCWNNANCVWTHGLSPDKLGEEVIDLDKLNKAIEKKADSVLYPNTHDITPRHLPLHLTYIRKLLEVYPQVTIISKPNLESIKAICKAFPEYRGSITFLFTIGTLDDEIRKFWEPKAPSIPERLECLKYAHSQGFKTSVIAEPMLDNNPDELVKRVKPFVTDVIWLGNGKRMLQRVSCNGHKDAETKARVRQLEAWQSEENTRALYQRLNVDPQVRWKETIQLIVGLQGPK